MTERLSTVVTMDSANAARVNVFHFSSDGSRPMPMFAIDMEGGMYTVVRNDETGWMRRARSMGKLLAVLKGTLSEGDVRVRMGGSPMLADDTEFAVFEDGSDVLFDLPEAD